ncbi:hypothetical protein [Nonlabens agnitus]|nr:hypothetical protein [Nonlabens agnitus]
MGETISYSFEVTNSGATPYECDGNGSLLVAPAAALPADRSRALHQER